MSKARQKGTTGENYFLVHLRELFGGEVERAPLKGTLDYGDYVNVPWLHEAKNTARPLFQKWFRVCKAKAGWDWVLLWKGDMRTPDGDPIVMMPLAKYIELVEMAKVQ